MKTPKSSTTDIEKRVRKAVKQFWATRARQSRKQGTETGRRDQGERKASTGGAQLDGFTALVRELLVENGVPADTIFDRKKMEIPGFFRAEKQWDLLVVADDHLVLAIEFKSQVGSFGNNFNNRTEEALGSATDVWTAYREGAFVSSPRPWLGYLMLLEESELSLKPVGVKEPHFKVFEEFRNASYAGRYQTLLSRLVRERLYDSACLMLSSKKSGTRGGYREPSDELSFQSFARSMVIRARTAFESI